MAEHITENILENIRTKKLSPDELIAVDDHLAFCDSCRDNVGSSFATIEAADRLEHALAQAHLTYEEIVDYVDGNVSAEAQTTIARHAAACDDCGIQVRELEVFASASPSPLVADASSSPSWFSSFTFLFPRPVAAVMSAVLLFIVGGLIWSLLQVDRTSDQTDATDVMTAVPQVDVTVIEPPLDPDVPAANARIEELAISIKDGGETVGISNSGELAGYSLVQPSYRTLIKNALASGKLNVADLRDLRGTAGTLMGDDSSPAGTFRLRSPVGKVVSGDTPTFVWEAVPGAGSYVVEVFDQSYNKVASSGELKTVSWKQRLERGRTYAWQVTAMVDGNTFKAPQRPQPDARFRIVDQRTSGDLSALRRTYPRSHLLLGIAYANVGLVDDARREFEILLQQNPNSEDARNLLRQIRQVK